MEASISSSPSPAILENASLPASPIVLYPAIASATVWYVVALRDLPFGTFTPSFLLISAGIPSIASL